MENIVKIMSLGGIKRFNYCNVDLHGIFHLLDNAVTTNIVKKITTLFLALFCPNTILEDSAVPY